jgi:2-dehydropantoate 2-reductase
MRVTFIGAGAMGGLFGSLMTEAGLDVQLVDIWEEHVEMIKDKGLRIDCDGQIRHVNLDIYTDYRLTRRADLVIVFVKGPQTAEAASAAAEIIAPDGMVLTLQNGLGNADILAKALDPEMVITGTTSYGSMVLGPGSIRHAGIGPTVIGPWAGGDLNKVAATARILTKGSIETEVKADVKALVWNKLMVNVGINAIVALTHIKNGQLVDLEALGISVRKDAVEHCWWVAKETAKARASMGQDVDAKRQTEIGTINGAIVRFGKELGIETPINFALTALITTWQNSYLNK